MRVAVLAGEFPLISQTFVIHHITSLLDLGHEVDIYVEYRPPAAGPVHAAVQRYGLMDNTHYMDVPTPTNGRRVLTAFARGATCLRRSPRLTLAVLNPLEYGRSALSLSALHRLYRLVKAGGRYDVLHAHFGMTGDRLRFTSALWDAPLVVSFHGFDCTVWPRTHGRKCYRHLFRSATAVTVNSENTRLRVTQLGCSPAKIHKVYAAWDMAAFAFSAHARQADAPVRLLTVARLIEIKGIEYAIRAVAQVRAQQRNIRYDIVGDGPLRTHLRGLISALGLEDCVTLHGAQSGDAVRQMMAAAHMLLHASATTAAGDEEGQGVVLVEAQAMGLPVVATRHGPFPELVRDGVTGFLVPERDADALAERVIYLIEHPAVATAMGLAGRQHVEERFDARQLAQQTVAIYEWAIRQHRLPASG